MIILYFLIPLTLILLGFALWAFFWAVKNDQFDDLEGPAYRILFDDDENDLPIEQRHTNTSDAPATSETREDEEEGKSEDKSKTHSKNQHKDQALHTKDS